MRKSGTGRKTSVVILGKAKNRFVCNKVVALLRVTMCICAVMVLLFASGCGAASKPEAAEGKLPVFVGIPPLAYLVEQIAGPYVEVDVLVQPGQDPHTFEPTPQQIQALGRAKIFFEIGMPFEGVLIQKIKEGNQQLEVVDTTVGIQKRRVDVPCEHEGAHAQDHPGEGGQPDPHVWLSPPLAVIMAKNITAALCRADPLHAADYEKNLTVLCQKFDTLHAKLKRKLAPYRGRSIYVFHPGFGYFTDTYGLKQEAVEEAGRSPTPKQLHGLIKEARAEGVKTIFTQPQYATQSAQVVAEAIGGRIAIIDGLKKNIINDVEDIAEKIEGALKSKDGEKNDECRNSNVE